MFMLPELKTDEIIMYLRKSRTDDPALTVSETVAKHEQMLDDYCMRTWSATIPEENRFREIVSGESIAARPEMQQVLHLIEQGRFRGYRKAVKAAPVYEYLCNNPAIQL